MERNDNKPGDHPMSRRDIFFRIAHSPPLVRPLQGLGHPTLLASTLLNLTLVT